MVTKNKSWEIIKECVGERIDLLAVKNHKVSTSRDKTYQFTIDMMSIDILFAFMERDEIRDVFFHPSSPPPGTHIDGIAQRYRVYVEYF